MARHRITRGLWPVLLAGLIVGCGGPAGAQVLPFAPEPDSRFELSDTVQLDQVDGTVLAHLERAKAYLADRQWDEAVQTLRQVMEGSEGKLLGVTRWRYVGLRDYCDLQLAGLPPEALKVYRSQVDPLAQKWYEQGMAQRSRRLLENVVDEAFASSWGDEALMALGEMALQSGQYASARWYWHRILPVDLPADAPRTWPGYPDSNLDPAAVRARLVLVSILEGSLDRAREELDQFTRLHPGARGRFAGREVNYAEALAGLLAEAASWPAPRVTDDWPTFAGNIERNKVAPRSPAPGAVAWRVPLEPIEQRGPAGAAAGDRRAPLGYHPVVAGDLLLVNSQTEILALRVATGEPAWGETAAVYRDAIGGLGDFTGPFSTLGTPRFTMTVVGDRAYARMGSPVTSLPVEGSGPIRAGCLVCLDLSRQGMLAWKIEPEKGWAFEGSPVADAANVYVAMRRSDIRPQAYVACYDAQTGRPRWRQFVCGAETPARGMMFQLSHNLLTFSKDRLYLNTNLGAVAALRADDGRLLWVSLYPRAREGDLARPAPHWQRDLNPCVLDRGMLLAAPADSPGIFAFDAQSGRVLWQTGPETEDVVHLLGTVGDRLIASGGRLYWIATRGDDRGHVKHVWPESDERPGYGRGLLAGGDVLFPTQEKIYILDQQTAQPKGAIDLVPYGLTGGNLSTAGGRLLVATGKELVALGGVERAAPPPAGQLTAARRQDGGSRGRGDLGI